MLYPSIYISGNIISQELIDKLDDDSAEGQRPSDFGLESGTRVRQDIARAWTDANDYWKIFKRKLDALKETEKGTTETRNLWTIPLLSLLGYDLRFQQQSEIINEKTYEISHRAGNRGDFPVMIVSAKEELDKKPEGYNRYRMSPHALLQEYLNVTEHTYGLVTNGKLIRLLRDNGRITRLTYLEFNLEKIFEEDLYADFALFYRLLHVSRMPETQTAAKDSIIDKYYEQAIEAGTRIRGSLSKAVEQAIRVFANGLLQHPDNNHLRDALQQQQLSELEFYQAQLRLVYRLLFIMTIEERRLVYPEELTPEQLRLSEIYNNYYSLHQLRNLAGKKQLVTPLHHNLYIQLWHNFRLFESGKYASKLGMQALGSGIFEPDKLEPFDSCRMYNRDLLNALYLLSYFTDEESGQHIRVNYGALNVEEFGSVYEGLLEYKAAVSEIEGKWQFNFVISDERSKSGSHYTPEELVQPLIKHSLDYLIEDKLKEKDPIAALLSLKVCDVACGSGHILLSAARRIALEVARKQFNEEQPSPAHQRWAIRQVINKCIYGIDKNPLAVELCKVAMWLEAHNPGEPLNFLDHHIKSGDSIVGLAHRSELEKGIADEAFKTLPGDDKDIAKTWRDKNVKERRERAAKALQLKAEFEKSTESSVQEALAEYKTFNQLPETTPDEIERKAKAYKKFIDGKGFSFLKAMADTQVAQFFIPKIEGNKDYLMTDADFRLILSGYKGWQDRKVAKATAVAVEQSFFHWFIEFPEVFSEGGFECVLGNPPFLGNRKLSGTFGEPFLEAIKYQFSPIGAVDLVTYFFRRIFTIIKSGGFQSLISTNTIAQGTAREDGLDIIVQQGGTISHAVKSMRWPGIAAVEVALVTITKQSWKGEFTLSGKQVKIITTYLDDAESLGNPFVLKYNEGKSFQGSIVLGKGFVLEPNEAKALIEKNPQNKNVLFPYLNGDDLNNNPDQSPSRWVINFFDWTEEKAKKYSDCYEIIEELVKPERQRWAKNGEGNEIIGEYALRKPLPEKWWIYADKRPALYESIKNLPHVLVVAKTTKYGSYHFAPKDIIYTQDLTVFPYSDYFYFVVFSSTIMNEWVWKNSATMGSNTIRLNPSDCFETFPFPQNLNLKQEQLETIGKVYDKYRKQLMLGMQLGLTKTYNLFHSNAITAQSINDKDKQVAALQNHLEKTPNTISFNEAIQGILKLRELHMQMDEAVLDAYGWNDIYLSHDFYEVDYLPENDRIRYTIHPDARKEVLKRLLELNHKIHEEEVKAGLWETKKTSTKKSSIVKKPNAAYGGDLFNQE